MGIGRITQQHFKPNTLKHSTHKHLMLPRDKRMAKANILEGIESTGGDT